MLLQLIWIFCFVQLWILHEGRVSKCCQSQGCVDSCPWSGTCANGQDYPCMEETSGYLNCQERTSACQRYDECDDNSAAHRTGNLCKTSPYFNGGYPMESFRWLSGTGELHCLEASDNGAYCRRWVGASSNMEEYYVTSANCTQSNSDETLCTFWVSQTIVNQRCFNSESTGDDGTTSSSKVCCHFGNRDYEKCCSTLCSDAEYTYRNTKIQYESCQCTMISSNSAQPVCVQSTCDQYYYTNQTYDEGRSYTNYQCIDVYNATDLDSHSSTSIVFVNASSNSMASTNYTSFAFCQNWMGNMESQETFALSSCQCLQANVTATGKLGYCDKWSCATKSANYYLPNTLWVLLPGLLGGLPLVLMLYITGWYRQRNIDILSFQVYSTRMQQVGDTVTRDAPTKKGSMIRAHLIPWLWFLVCNGLTVVAIWKTGLIALFACGIPMVVIFAGVMGWYAYQMAALEKEMTALKQTVSSSSTSSSGKKMEPAIDGGIAINPLESITLNMPLNP